MVGVNMLGYLVIFVVGFIIGYICGYKTSYDDAYLLGRRHGYQAGISEHERIKNWPKGSMDKK